MILVLVGDIILGKQLPMVGLYPFNVALAKYGTWCALLKLCFLSVPYDIIMSYNFHLIISDRSVFGFFK